jgi:ubiquinone/menaquinone biosynthesis C-methylase UbiE
MDSIHAFSSKAEKYARYRWDYDPQAVQAIFAITQVTVGSSVADIGAGTGILTKHFLGKAGQVFAVEPNPEMREIALRSLGDHPECTIREGRAEATTLPDGSVDLIVVGQAFNWFDPHPTRLEFTRILKPVGWLAALRNYGTDQELGAATQAIYPAETDTLAIMKGVGTPISFYFGNDFLQQTYPFTYQQTFEQFLGALSSASYAPDEGNPWYPEFTRQAREVFEHFARNGLLASHGVTELSLGHMN